MAAIAGTAVTVWIAGAKHRVTLAIKKKLNRRNASEPIIGHPKIDDRLGRNFLTGELGEALNALLYGAAHNLRKILRPHSARLNHFTSQPITSLLSVDR